ncbi:hypothetical protein CVV65_01640 [Kyrpidia spormannii]|uniref:SIR2-like domain-containing protein n=1 Tax=Kyrpidia spormannii TaxID=2055160 RepID=A0A2K8N5T8_9BACL|nr:hypothetical protein [Kyrpidia spormannii]ATY83832.1 hypothetical protein CVV65_01640 [Kyrpidia spormannii]
MEAEIKSHRPRWPETAIFWGGGATASLGMKTTVQLAKSIWTLADRNLTLEERVRSAFGNWIDDRYGHVIRDLLLILGDDSMPLGIEAGKRQFAAHTETDIMEIVQYLRVTYDWATLREVIHACPIRRGESPDGQYVPIQDIFNVLDLHIGSGLGFRVPGHGQSPGMFIRPDRLRHARNALILLFLLLHSLGYQELIHNKQSVLKTFEQFATVLYDLMIEEGLRLAREGKPLQERNFYLFSYSVISMNWDPLLLWLMLNCHKRGNNSVHAPYVGNPPQKLKLFLDIGALSGVRQVDGKTPDIWYSFNETVVQRINDPEHVTGRRARVGKFFFPHGSSSSRECPNCGKVVVCLGDEWSLQSPGIFPPLPLPGLQFGFRAKSREEVMARRVRGCFDGVQCPFCGEITELKDTPLILQTNFKGGHGPSLEQIQRDMRASLEGARHLVFLGYSVPPDDFIYRSVFTARKNHAESVYCSVVVGYDPSAPDKWLIGDELKAHIQRVSERSGIDMSFVQMVESMWSIFGMQYVRAYARGIPDVFLDPGSQIVSADRVRELLYPANGFAPGVFPSHQVVRN